MTAREERQRLRALYQARFAVVAPVLRAWDPYRLLALGAPLDELDGEIQRVVARWDEVRSREDATRVIAEVFASAFDSRDFPHASAADVGARLYRAMRGNLDVPGGEA
ncbi:MAG: hypothetical protein JNM84_19780 [Planctomycetes bacterium]|nr:hypothetical protein [Planctomycetota bacterium]